MEINLNNIKQRFGIVGRSEKLDRALYTAARVAPTDLSVLIQGESGVGKEAFSRIIHELSKRKHNNFIAINCGAIPAGTINSELFGHEKGAFTGATGERKGYFETVDGGTIFLDEIGEMPLDTQAFLLRILERGEFLRVGSSKVQTTNVRIIAATNVNLENAIKSGKFREDLFYRLNTVPIFVPPLRERKEDIYMLFRRFAVDFGEKYHIQPIQLDDDAKAIIEQYSWPGNIRELKNLVEQLSIMSDNKKINVETLVRIAPHILDRNLPSMYQVRSENNSGFQEREILFKFLLEMKADLNDLKNLVHNLISSNGLTVLPPTSTHKQELENRLSQLDAEAYEQFAYRYLDPGESHKNFHLDSKSPQKPLILGEKEIQHYQKSEIVEEDLSLEKMEIDMIVKALKKNRGRRKDAAAELGISERTLYRKIKEYNITE